MEVTLRGLVSLMHGLLFGGFFLMAVSGVVVELCRSAYAKEAPERLSHGAESCRLPTPWPS